MKNRLTNTQFRNKDSIFGKACIMANVKTTVRQASKFRRGKGIAYKVMIGKAAKLDSRMPGFEDWRV
jgi:hypothetical protein